jgi:hypothetical protein
MNDPANKNGPISDPDDAEEARFAARFARIRRAAMNYVGLPDLLELGIATARELRQAQADLNRAQRADTSRPDLLAIITTKTEELSAIQEATTDANILVKLWDQIALLGNWDRF